MMGSNTASPVATAGPSYLHLVRSGELKQRVARLDSLLEHCVVCPHGCRVDRRRQLGSCGIGSEPVVTSTTAHFGEEPIISGERGSGAVFVAGCNLRCVYCQNHEISQPSSPERWPPTSVEALATSFLELQERGCHNLNWVSPSHQIPQLVHALLLAAERGLRLPIVYNSNGYESVPVLQLLDGVVDIYLPDLKYGDAATAMELSSATDYPHHAQAAVTEMLRQVGEGWRFDDDGVLRRGLLVRMLVLPNDLADISISLQSLAALSPRIGVSLMAQYYPTHHATVTENPLLSRAIAAGEWERAVSKLEQLMEGDHHYLQDHTTAPEYYRPDFSDPATPFKDILDFTGG